MATPGLGFEPRHHYWDGMPALKAGALPDCAILAECDGQDSNLRRTNHGLLRPVPLTWLGYRRVIATERIRTAVTPHGSVPCFTAGQLVRRFAPHCTGRM